MQHVLANTVLSLMHPVLVARFVQNCGHLPSVAVPETTDEKYLWRKIFDRNPLFVTLSDKLETKRYMAERFPAVKTAQVLWEGDDIRNAPRELLDLPGFLKANHASGFNFRLGTSAPDLDELHRLTRKWLRVRYHTKHGEWGYAGVRPRLFIEEDLGADATDELTDFTIYAYNERITHFATMHGHKTNHVKVARFDGDGKRLARPLAGASKVLGKDQLGQEMIASVLPATYRLPPGFEQMLSYSRELTKGCDHLRVDFIWNGHDFFLTEVTIYSMAGYIDYEDDALIRQMASSWELRDSWFLQTPQSGWRKLYANWLARRLGSAT